MRQVIINKLKSIPAPPPIIWAIGVAGLIILVNLIAPDPTPREFQSEGRYYNINQTETHDDAMDRAIDAPIECDGDQTCADDRTREQR